jgi:hypothetical protein
MRAGFEHGEVMVAVQPRGDDQPRNTRPNDRDPHEPTDF